MTMTHFCPECGAANEEASASCFACGQPLESAIPVDGAAGTENENLLHGRYRVCETLGSGGFSTVSRGQDLWADGQEVAIKQMTLDGLTPQAISKATETFQREVRILSSLDHPQVPQIYAHFTTSDHCSLVLQYFDGLTLETYLENRADESQPITVDEALSMSLQLCRVLEYLHSRQPPLIFRDLKPGNIIRRPDGTLCLIDFGITRAFRAGQAHDTQALGSPGYAAPEQYGQAQTTPQSDIYSLGALLHALLSGQDPSEHPLDFAPLRLAGQVGESKLVSLVQRMLALKAIDRPTSVHEVALELEAIQNLRFAPAPQRHELPSTSSAPHPPTVQRLGTRESLGETRLPLLPAPVRPERPRRTALRGVLLLVILVVGGSLGTWRVLVTVQANHNVPAPVRAGVPGRTWHTHEFFGDATAIVWSGSQFVAVGDSGTILTSPDGHTWTAQNAGENLHLLDLAGVAWSGSQFVAVGAGDGPSPPTSTPGITLTSIIGVILTSPDGHTWTTQNAGASRALQSVIWSGSQFVAVGYYGTILTFTVNGTLPRVPQTPLLLSALRAGAFRLAGELADGALSWVSPFRPRVS